VIPAKFDYEVADSVEQAIELLGSREEAKLLAGGHSLLPLMKLRLARPELVVDVGRLSDLSYVRDAGEQLAIGALTRHHDLERDPLLQEHCPIVCYAAGLVGDPQVRHRGTIGGSVAHGDPASDLPTVLLALDAGLVARGPDGERTIAAAEFFTGFLETALGPQEVLTEIRVPKLGTWKGWSYVKFNRRAQDWATVGVAAITRREDGKVEDAAIGLTNMGATPLRARAVEQALAGASVDDVATAVEVADEGTSPPSDPNGSAEYRRHLARVLTRRALEEALSR
jgi:aerobic carbon-monoxide dehydrogenase medium subunit